MHEPTPVMTIPELSGFLEKVFPQTLGFGFKIDVLKPSYMEVVLPTSDRHLRPGGTVSGPTMMTLADTAAYLVILAHIGPKALAVTTHMSMDFLRKPEVGHLVAQARLLKLGRRLAVCGIEIYDARPALVASTNLTYSIPPER